MALKVTPEEEKKVKALGFLRNKGTDNFSGDVYKRQSHYIDRNLILWSSLKSNL